MAESKSIFVKLQAVRAALAAMKLMPTGRNAHMGYSYLELGDFLPHVSKLCAEQGICPIFNMGKDAATLVIADGGEKEITFTMPTGEAKLAGNASPVQCLGAARTYMMRYLYSNAFEIQESDGMEAAYDKKAAPPAETRRSMRQAQEELFTEAQKWGVSNSSMKEMMSSAFGKASSSQLTIDEIDVLIHLLRGEA